MSRDTHLFIVALFTVALFFGSIYGAAWYFPDPGIAGLQRAGIEYTPPPTYRLQPPATW